MHAKDELYSNLRGPAKNLTVLATAYADPANKGTGEHEPILFTVNYGKGRTFHTVLGHVKGKFVSSVECVGFITTFQRGAEWAATGKVTQEIPADFPTATQVRQWPEYRPAALKDVLKNVSTYKFGQTRELLTQIDDLVRPVDKSPEKLRQIEKQLIEFLNSDATPDGKEFICRKLSIIGSRGSVKTLAKMLEDKNTSNMARYALERIDDTAVDDALRSALSKTAGADKIGIINTLGRRRDKKSVSILKKLIDSSDTQEAEAAVAALGKIADSKAADVLAKAARKAKGNLQMLIYDAYLNCAEDLLRQDEKKKAFNIYDNVYDSSAPKIIRLAALRGKVYSAKKGHGKIILNALKEKDPRIQAVASMLVSEVNNKKEIITIAQQLPKLPPAGQVQLITALAERAHPAAREAVVAAAKSQDVQISSAGLKGLALLGGGSDVALLARKAANTTGDQRAAARQSLYNMRGDKVDKAIIAQISKADPKTKVELIRAIARRNILSAADTVLQTAKNPDKKVRIESQKTLRQIAAPAQLKDLVNVLINIEDSGEKKEAEKTLAAVARKIPESTQRAKIILSALRIVRAVGPRSSLINVLGKIGDDSSLNLLYQSLGHKSLDIRYASVSALSEWPNPNPLEKLLSVVKTTDDEKHRILALRGYIRLLSLESSRPPERTVKMYVAGMNLAANVTEKKMLLSGLAETGSSAAIKVAASYLDDDELRQEAQAAAVNIAETSGGSSPQAAKDVLEKVIRTSQNDSLKDRAKQVLEKFAGLEDYLVTWRVSGPYTKKDVSGSDLFDMDFAPETSGARDLDWRIIPISIEGNRPFMIDLDEHFGGDDRVAYLITKVISPKLHEVMLELGSDDGVKVWVNGHVVHANNAVRPAKPGNDKVKITLHKGSNIFLIKVTQGSGFWKFCARLRALDGSKLEGLSITADGVSQMFPGVGLVGADLSAWRPNTGTWQVVGDALKDPERQKFLAVRLGSGVIINGPKGRTTDIFSKAQFGDVRAHVEFMVPKGSNSGVYFQERYEIQVLDSWGVKEPKHSDCGGIYQRWDEKREPKGYEGKPPRVNASLAPGKWQSFDIVFRAPRFDESGKKTANAVFEKVIHNGIVIHENQEMTGPTRGSFGAEKPLGPLRLQGDHGPVAYRNVYIEELN